MMGPVRRAHQVLAISSAAIAIIVLAVVPHDGFQDDPVARLTAEFHRCYAEWSPEQGVRSPCPETQNALNVALLEKYDLLHARPDRVIAVTGRPLTVYRHEKYPEITYWKTQSYWVTMAPTCLMLLPRNPQYDAMMLMEMQESAARISEASEGE